MDVSGERVGQGDPHLKVVMPQMWYQVGYKGALNATGLAGVPGLLIGHNGSSRGPSRWPTATSRTSSRRFRADGQYEHKGEWREADVTSFAVKGAREPTTVRIQRTVHQPMLETALGCRPLESSSG